MDKNRAFELAKMYLENLGTWDAVNETWGMTEVKEVKRCFGLLSHRCPLCQTKMQYFNILCCARTAEGAAAGKPRTLPLMRNSISCKGAVFVQGDLQLGICKCGHKTARVRVSRSGTESAYFGYLVNQFRANEMVFISCP